jgi:hypothetical protein
VTAPIERHRVGERPRRRRAHWPGPARVARAAWAVLAAAAFVVAPRDAAAHELRPGYLELRETSPEVYQVVWKKPAQGEYELRLDPVFPADCAEEAAPGASSVPGAVMVRATLRCAGGLGGKTLWIDGLATTLTDVLAPRPTCSRTSHPASPSASRRPRSPASRPTRGWGSSTSSSASITCSSCSDCS